MVNREKALAKRHSKEKEKWTENTKEMKPLEIADHVYLQNLVGNHPLRWERTGVVLEVKPFNQYVIRLDGSGRVTLRNRRHLRKFTPFVTTRNILSPQIPQQLTHASKPSKPATPTIKVPLMTPQQPVVPDVHPIQPEAPDDHPTTHPEDNHDQPEAPPPRDKNLPLALRRLLAHNKSGRKE